MPLLIALVPCWVGLLLAWRPAWLRLSAAAARPASTALAIAAFGNLWRNGTFEIASWGGVSLLGKGLILAEPLPPDDPLSALNWVAGETRVAGDAIAAIPDLHLRMLVVRPYAESLRFFLVWNQFQDRWSEWQASDGKGMGLLAGRLANAYIGRDRSGYARLVALDYASQGLIPRPRTTAWSGGWVGSASVPASPTSRGPTRRRSTTTGSCRRRRPSRGRIGFSAWARSCCPWPPT